MNMELTSYYQWEESGKDQKERGDTSPCVLQNSQNPSCWNISNYVLIIPTDKWIIYT